MAMIMKEASKFLMSLVMIGAVTVLVILPNGAYSFMDLKHYVVLDIILS